jgi:TolB protein
MLGTARKAIVGALLIGALGGCTDTQEPPPAASLDFPPTGATGATDATPAPTGATETSEESPAPTRPSSIDALGGHLAVLAADGSLETMLPDGTKRITLAEPESDRVKIQQPAWSRDGEHVAWVRAELHDNGVVSGVLETSTADGRVPTVTETDTVPFYLSWDPTSSRIGYLGSLSPEEIGFGVVELDAGGRPTASIDSGRPFYLSWAPDGEELLVHASEDRLERLGIDGRSETVVERPATFNVPYWTSDGSTLIYGANARGGQALVAQDADTGETTPLLRFEAGLIFVASPDGSRIAYQTIDAANPAGPLTVLDVRSGEKTQLVDHLVAAFFWSPDGEKLLYLDPDPSQDQFWYRWGIWNGTTVFETPHIVPSLLMVDDYLPFFEQYSQSMSLWSPDSKAFAYAGFNEQGEAGIWVQEARPDRAPVVVSDGEFVSWSPA